MAEQSTPPAPVQESPAPAEETEVAEPAPEATEEDAPPAPDTEETDAPEAEPQA